MKTDSLFASTAARRIAVIKLAEESRADVDAPVGDVLPEVGNATVADGRKLKRAITLHQLLIHTSDLGYTFLLGEDFASSQKLEGAQRDGGENWGVHDGARCGAGRGRGIIVLASTGQESQQRPLVIFLLEHQEQR
ncbi:BZ3500_MvSof-1268-A1-R1_Chr3-1g05902 [Microbotryum saponariae]|uniref:BZ3500_MvSof-1268-A1-R1_Chr3-1g05902 protein n=1 Tax=Microbotryum saponariae TaxID=289078 RepID=A0A2X0NC03_9BASI|nr:BZ3500_MvSof-1268-A1-R1_Chr3-1g05902 [Microbotryum saponariae]SDA05092.1 BZ3501_MvSof-1269-A2-R1_Chr3-1g05572 [Microbotryum saponariae]